MTITIMSATSSFDDSVMSSDSDPPRWFFVNLKAFTSHIEDQIATRQCPGESLSG